MRDAAYDAIRSELKNLASFATGIIPHKIAHPSLEPDREDAVELQNDLMLLARKVDAVILAYGEYCRCNGILSKSDIKDCFTDVLEGALAGNGMYLIESGVEDRLQYLEDEQAEHAYRLSREPV